MPITQSEANLLLDYSVATLTPQVLSLNDETGAEVSGGGYQRRPVTFASADAGQVTNSQPVTVPNMPAVALLSWALRESDQAGRATWTGLFSAQVATADGQQIYAGAGAVMPPEGDRVVFDEAVIPPGSFLIPGQPYYVRTSSQGIITVSETLGGNAVYAGIGNLGMGNVVTVAAGDDVVIDAGTIVLSLV